MRYLLTLSLCAVLAACGPAKPAKPSPEDISKAVDLEPSDQRIADIYERSCMSCHSSPDSGAPLAGFKAGWKPRLAKGDAVLLQHVKSGFNAMPARGLCEDCSDDDYRKLIAFMSGTSS